MSNPAKNTFNLWGLLTGLAIVLMHAWEIHAKLETSSRMQLALQVPMLIGIIANAFLFSRAHHGYATFGKIFLSCFYATLIVVAIRLIWVPVSIQLFPDIKAHQLSELRAKFDKTAGMGEDYANHVTDKLGKYWTTITVINVLFNTLIFGTIFALVGAAIVPKKVVATMPEN